MIYSDNALTVFKEKYAKDLILSVFGDEAELYANDFEFNESNINKYKDTILNNLDFIQNKTIIDIGSNTGLWAVLMYLNGANSVTCIEPRKQFSDGINIFAKKHNLPIECVNGFHSDVFSLKTVDTIFMMGVDDLIVDVTSFLFSLRKQAENLILKTAHRDHEVEENSIKIRLDHNFYHRAGFSINQINNANPIGYETDINQIIKNKSQGRFLRHLYGKNFFETLFDYLDFEIVKYKENRSNKNDSKYKIYSVKMYK